MKFERGDQVEICCNEPGFENSYFPATIISSINQKNEYIVQFNTLLGHDEQYPLREFRPIHDLRPAPPVIDVTRFELGVEVDAYANDGWWKGIVSKTGGFGKGNNNNNNNNNNNSRYYVKFDRGGGEVELGLYSFSCLRVHQDWVNDHWVCSNNNNKKMIKMKNLA